jgi:hypothetical protein
MVGIRVESRNAYLYPALLTTSPSSISESARRRGEESADRLQDYNCTRTPRRQHTCDLKSEKPSNRALRHTRCLALKHARRP